MPVGLAKILFIVFFSFVIFGTVTEIFDGNDERISYLLSLIASALLVDRFTEV